MFRAAARSLVTPAARRAAFAPAPVRFAPSLLVQQRFYAASSLSADTIKARIEDVLKSFEKVEASKVSSRAPNPSRLTGAGPGTTSGGWTRICAACDRTQSSPRWAPEATERQCTHPDCYNQVSPTASFTNDLGLDSLDAVEVVMAIEGPSRFPCVSHFGTWLTNRDNLKEEFAIEIPDEDADRITTVGEGESPCSY